MSPVFEEERWRRGSDQCASLGLGDVPGGLRKFVRAADDVDRVGLDTAGVLEGL